MGVPPGDALDRGDYTVVLRASPCWSNPAPPKAVVGLRISQLHVMVRLDKKPERLGKDLRPVYVVVAPGRKLTEGVGCS